MSLPWLPAEEDDVLGSAVQVTEGSQVGEARRWVVHCARQLGFDETAAGKAAIVATEMAGNLVKHAGGGEIVVRPLANGAAKGLEILALDRGPGIDDVAKSLRDGYSTAGTPGTGLGAIARLADLFDLYSAPGQGTALLAHLWPKADAAGPVEDRRRTEHGAVCLPVAGEAAPGDGWDIQHRPRGWRLLVADGLGHGPFAREPSARAIQVFREAPDDHPPVRILEACHAALQGTRGAAVAIADVDLEGGVVLYAGIGNVAGSVTAAGQAQHLVSFNGIVGQGVIKAREFRYAWAPGALLVMASDGLGTRWRLDAYPGLSARHPGLIAGVLYRDHGRRRDDVTVVASRERADGTAAWKDAP